MTSDLSPETEGELQVPAHIWGLPHFQCWLRAQKKAGNRLDGFKSVFEHYVADGKFLFFWAAHVDIYVASEHRNKSNEIVISRPDISHVVMFNESLFGTAHVVLVREFRSPATTPDGFILESPGGSSFKPEAPLALAAKEVREETGIELDASRFRKIGARQLMGTMSAHKAHVYGVKLTDEELTEVGKNIGKVFGEADSSERTYLEIHSVQSLLKDPSTDWSTLGMIAATIEALS